MLLNQRRPLQPAPTGAKKGEWRRRRPLSPDADGGGAAEEGLARLLQFSLSPLPRTRSVFEIPQIRYKTYVFCQTTIGLYIYLLLTY